MKSILSEKMTNENFGYDKRLLALCESMIDKHTKYRPTMKKLLEAVNRLLIEIEDKDEKFMDMKKSKEKQTKDENYLSEYFCFNNFLYQPEQREHFKEFLRSEFSVEALLFIEEVEKLYKYVSFSSAE